jgi:hypothetical protein
VLLQVRGQCPSCQKALLLLLLLLGRLLLLLLLLLLLQREHHLALQGPCSSTHE